MATFTVINVKTQSVSRLATSVDYISQKHKTELNDRQYVSGHNCRVESCLTEMLATKARFRKTGGTMFYHFVQSFSEQEQLTPDEAHQIGLELAAELFPDHEALVATHVDTDNLHSHILVNSVSFVSGRKLHQNRADLVRQRAINDRICEQHQLQVLPSYTSGKRRIKPGEYRAAQRGQSWKFRLMWQIDEVMRFAGSREEFIQLMQAEGYGVKWTDSRKNITYTTPQGQPCRDNKLHEEKYLKARMEDEFKLRAEIIGLFEVAESAATAAIPDDQSGNRGIVGHGCGDLRSESGYVGRNENAAKTGQRDQNTADAGQYSGSAEGDFRAVETGWEAERVVYLAATYSLQDDTSQPAFAPAAADHGSIVGDAIQLGRSLELAANADPLMDSTTMQPHIDSKDRRRIREKRIAMGQKEDNTDQSQDWQQTMY